MNLDFENIAKLLKKAQVAVEGFHAVERTEMELRSAASSDFDNVIKMLQQLSILNSFGGININDLIKNLQNLLKEKMPNVIYALENRSTNSVEENINSFNDIIFQMNVFRNVYSLSVFQTRLQQNLIDISVNRKHGIINIEPSNGRSMHFLIPLLHNIRPNLKACQTLVLVPDEYLAIYVQKVIKNLKDLLGIEINAEILDNTNTITPPCVDCQVFLGKPIDIARSLNFKNLNIRLIKSVIIIEPNKMRSPHNLTIINDGILERLPQVHITVFESSDVGTVMDVYNRIITKPSYIFFDSNEQSNIFIDFPNQFYISTDDDSKTRYLIRACEFYKDKKFILFCNSFIRAQMVYTKIKRFKRCLLYLGTNDRHTQDKKLELFSSNAIEMLITMDPIKGNQFQNVDFIINYDIPQNPIYYLNRIAYCKTEAKVLNFVNICDRAMKSAIETLCKIAMMHIPRVDMLNS